MSHWLILNPNTTAAVTERLRAHAAAATRHAAARGRFAIVTGGAAWGPMLRRLALSLGYADALAGVHVVAPTGAGLAGMAAALAGDMPIPLIDSVTAGVQALLEDSDAFSAGMTDGPPTSR